MSKFDEMCEVFRLARKRGIEFRDRCWQTMGALVDGFLKYCEIPYDQVQYRPLNKEPKEDTQYTMLGATHFGHDGYWHLGLVISLYAAPNEFPRQPVLIELCVTEHAGKTIAKAGTDVKPREVDVSNDAQRREFYDELVEAVKKFFAAEPGFEETPSLKKVGFTSG